MVGEGKLSKKDIRKIRLSFWLLWTFGITSPVILAAYLLHGSWWVSPVIMTVSTVFGYNYCEWLLKRRQWKAENTVIRCECSHTENVHYGELGGLCQYSKRISDSELHCTCPVYVPTYWTMSGRV